MTAEPLSDGSPSASPPPSPASGHALADHAYGQDLQHEHVPGASYDHDHDHFEGDDGPLEENPIWIQDHVTLVSVGMDIGSSGTQVIFSRINLRRLGEDLSSRYFVVSRDTLYQSPVALTPYQSDERIDERALGAIIDDAYANAGMRPRDIDTGAVILTGEALRRENAEGIAGILAEHGGDFVCAAAGHHMEAMLAAYGSGAARLSSDDRQRILNIDIGGGTTKLAIVEAGRVVATAAFHVGGRLQVVDAAQRVVRLDPAGRHLAAQAGYSWSVGDLARPDEMQRVADWMADAVIAAITQQPLPVHLAALYLTDPLPELGLIDGVIISGGVGEYVYGRETRDFQDMGRLLGTALRRRLDAGGLPWPLLPARECIRATALGASEYSVQLSGNTIFVSSPGTLLPRRNLQVLRPNYDFPEVVDPDGVAQAIAAHFAFFDLFEGETEVALAFHWQGAPSYPRIAALAEGVVRALAKTTANGKPLYLVLDGDVAQTLGFILKDELGLKNDVMVIDGVVLWDFDYVDLGRVRLPSNTVPVTVKSLVFEEDPRSGQRLSYDDGHQHHHDHHHGHHHGHGHDHDHGHHHDGHHHVHHDDRR
jgi:ethanolamine utilization protein EutA